MQGCCQDAFYLQMGDGKNVHNILVVQQVGSFTVEHLTFIHHSTLPDGAQIGRLVFTLKLDWHCR